MRKLLALLCVLWALPATAQYSISQFPPATTPLTGTELFPCTQSGTTRKCLTGSVAAAANAAFVLQAPNASLPLSRTLAGTANEILLADGGPLGNLVLSTPQPIAPTSSPTFSGLTLTGALSGTSATFTGALSALSLSLTNPLPATSGGTGQSGYAVGDILAADSTITLSRVPDVSAGSYLRSGGVNTLPLWSTLKLPNAATQGDILFASGANSIGNLADVAAGSYLRSGGVGANPLYSTLTLPNAATTGDLFIATGANAMGNLADVAVGSYLRSNGVGATPVYSTTTIPNTAVLGDIWYGSVANVVSALAGNTTSSKRFLTQTGTGAVSAAPGWNAIVAGDLPGSFSGFANPTASVGLSTVNGSATTAMRSDAAPALSQSIAPTWTALHTFTHTPTSSLNGSILLSDTNNPILGFTVTGAGANNKVWDIVTTSTQFIIRTADDSGGSNVNAIAVTRSGTSVSSVSIAGSVALPGITNTSAAQTGTMCWASANISYDPTVGCLTSSIRFKQGIEPLDDGLFTIMQMRPVSYDIKPEYDSFHLGRQVGMVAEEVAKIDPRLVGYDPDGEHVRGIRYQQLTAVLVKAIQQQQIEIYSLYALVLFSFGYTFWRTRLIRTAGL